MANVQPDPLPATLAAPTAKSGRIEHLLRNSQAFVAEQLALDPGYFERLSKGQHLEFLWIGCSKTLAARAARTISASGRRVSARRTASACIRTSAHLRR